MNRSLTILLLLLLFPSISVLGQSSFKPGYMISRQNDTIRGEIKFRNNTQNYQSCLFKTANGEQEYSPEEIKAFGYDDDKTFVTGIVEGSFVEHLISGEMSLFKFENEYYLKKGATVKVLASDIRELVIEGKTVRRETSQWKGVVAYMISDCMPQSNRRISNLKFAERSLVKLVAEYNTCQGADFTEHKSEKPWGHVDMGVAVGMNSTELKFEDTGAAFNYLSDSYSGSSITAGLVFAFSSPRLSENLALQTELHFSKTNYNSYYVRGLAFKDYYDLTIDLSTLSLPVSVKYTIPKKGFGYFFQGGINYDYSLTSDVTLRIEETQYDNSINSSVITPFDMEGGFFGVWGGLGIMKTFNRVDMSLALRYFTMSAPDLRERVYDHELTSRRDSFALNLIVGLN